VILTSQIVKLIDPAYLPNIDAKDLLIKKNILNQTLGIYCGTIKDCVLPGPDRNHVR
jgi:hypothetical protein